MTSFDTPDAAVDAPRRQIRVWGSLARLAVGAVMIVGALIARPSTWELLVGLVALPAVEVGVLALRGRDAQPLRLYGQGGHCLNFAIGIPLFVLVPVPALLFYGSSILLAFVRGYAGCEIFAISNWLRSRDDQIACPVFSPIDHWEARRVGEAPAC